MAGDERVQARAPCPPPRAGRATLADRTACARLGRLAGRSIRSSDTSTRSTAAVDFDDARAHPAAQARRRHHPRRQHEGARAELVSDGSERFSHGWAAISLVMHVNPVSRRQQPAVCGGISLCDSTPICGSTRANSRHRCGRSVGEHRSTGCASLSSGLRRGARRCSAPAAGRAPARRPDRSGRPTRAAAPRGRRDADDRAARRSRSGTAGRSNGRAPRARLP